ncbi:MAG TPA: reactive intermediate/imine deaminase [Flavobacteriaceae bacterium]|jgi:enamine deaminase RidA (YjgF/YER057c/UK114 family)|nr:reactive intermediate/imine deaminase [Flavobacteriaceae bacterium]
MKIIDTPKMSKTNGYYSQCIEHNGTLYLSGQLPIGQKTKSIPSSIEEQTDLVLKNIESILIEAGSSKNHKLQARILSCGIKLMNDIVISFKNISQQDASYQLANYTLVA